MTSEPITRQDFSAGVDALRYELKADIAQLETRLTRWMVTLLVAAVIVSSTIASAITFFAQTIGD